jgi:hypothetical protein
MLLKVERLSKARALNAKLFHVELFDSKLLGDQIRLG